MRDAMVEFNRARFPATRPRVFCELKIMKIVILICQIIQEKFAYGELFMLVMIGYIFMFKMVKEKGFFFTMTAMGCFLTKYMFLGQIL